MEIDFDDFFAALFSDKYEKKFKLDILSQCETDGSLKKYIKKHHPKYYMPHRDMVMIINLTKDLGYW